MKKSTTKPPAPAAPKPCAPPPGDTCPAMSRALQAAGGADRRQAGLDVVVILSRGRRGAPDFKPMIIYRSGPKDAGLALNFCPWCGGPLRADAVRWGVGGTPAGSASPRRRAS